MTTQEQIIAAGFEHFEQFPDDYKQKLVALYNIAYEAGRVAEREDNAARADSYAYMSQNFTALAEEIRARGESK